MAQQMQTEHKTAHFARGCALVLAGSCLWGIAGSVAKLLMDRTGVDPLWVTCAKMLFASLLFFILAARQTPDKLHLMLHERHQWPYLLFIGLTAYLLLNAAYFVAVDLTNSGTATVLQSLGLLMVLIYVCAREHRRPRRREVLGFACALTGTYLLATGGNPATLMLPLAGLIAGLLTAAGQACVTVAPVRAINRYGSLCVNAVGFLVAGLTLISVTSPWIIPTNFALLDWGFLAFSIVVGSFIANALYMQGLKEAGTLTTTLLSTSEQVAATISTVVLSSIFFSPAELIGMTLVIIMVFLTA